MCLSPPEGLNWLWPRAIHYWEAGGWTWLRIQMGKQCRWTLASHQACLALLFFYLTLNFGFNHQQLQTFSFWSVWYSLLATETVWLACTVEMVTNSACGGCCWPSLLDSINVSRVVRATSSLRPVCVSVCVWPLKTTTVMTCWSICQWKHCHKCCSSNTPDTMA